MDRFGLRGIEVEEQEEEKTEIKFRELKAEDEVNEFPHLKPAEGEKDIHHRLRLSLSRGDAG